MRTIGERLRQVIESKGFNPKTFCEKFSMNYTGLTMILKNERPLGMNILMQLKEAVPELDTNWLLFDENENVSVNEKVYKNENNSLPEANEPISSYDITEPFEAMLLDYMDRPRIKAKIKEILKGK